ncbi:MAG TPA: O-antigen ligase family protein [Anaerolineae bacterium]|nr:O-antigen ligase family protein [Anaerolineae bacterium]
MSLSLQRNSAKISNLRGEARVIAPAIAYARQRFSTVEALLIGFVAVYPLIVNPLVSPVFGLPKLTFLKLAAIAIAGVWIVSAINKGSFTLHEAALKLPVGAFFIFMLLSGVQSVHPLTSLFGQYGRWEGMLTIVCYLVLFAAGHGIAKHKDVVKPLFLAVLISSVLVSAVAIIEHFWTNPFLLFAKVYCGAGFGEPNTFETGRSMATFGSPTFLATYLALTLPVILSYIVSGRRDAAPKGIAYPALLLVSVALLLTFGRAAWIGAAAGIALIVWLTWNHIRKSRTRIIAVLLIFALALVIVGLVGHTYSVPGRIASTFKIEGSTLARIQMWEASLPLISENPLLGSGPDTFKYVFGKHKPEGWAEHITDPLVDKAHNDILQIAVTHGALGLLAYLWIFIVLLWFGIRKVRLVKKPRETWLAAGMLGAVLGYFIQLQFGFSHFTTAPYFWIFMGLVSGRLLTGKRITTISIGVPDRLRALTLSVPAIAVISLMVMSIMPLIADIHFARGRELQSAKSIPEAINEYQSAVRFNGLEPLYRISLAEELIQLGTSTGNNSYIHRGSNAFAEAERLNPVDEQVYFRSGAAFLEAGRTTNNPDLLRKSIEEHSRGLTLNPVMVDAYLDVGVAHAYLDNYDDAIDAWSDALAIEPGNDRAYFNLGWAYEHKGQWVRAKKAYLKAYRLNPKMVEAKIAYDRL